MNGLIKNGVVRRCWIARHGPDTARRNQQQLGAIESKGYEFLADGNTSHIPAESH
jgi:hypothetical protein